jgi:hypothetical protein
MSSTNTLGFLICFSIFLFIAVIFILLYLNYREKIRMQKISRMIDLRWPYNDITFVSSMNLIKILSKEKKYQDINKFIDNIFKKKSLKSNSVSYFMYQKIYADNLVILSEDEITNSGDISKALSIWNNLLRHPLVSKDKEYKIELENKIQNAKNRIEE